jgi:hypothetical protein
MSEGLYAAISMTVFVTLSFVLVVWDLWRKDKLKRALEKKPPTGSVVRPSSEVIVGVTHDDKVTLSLVYNNGQSVITSFCSDEAARDLANRINHACATVSLRRDGDRQKSVDVVAELVMTVEPEKK